MSKIAIDLKDFKYDSHDDKSTTLKHAKHKHVVTILHKPLSKDARAQLEAMACGGEVQPKATDNAPKSIQKTVKVSANVSKNAPRYYEGDVVMPEGVLDPANAITPENGPDVLAKRDLYDQLQMSAAAKSPIPTSPFEDDKYFSGAKEPGESFDTSKWQQATQIADQDKAEAKQSAILAQQRMQEQGAARAAAGLKPQGGASAAPLMASNAPGDAAPVQSQAASPQGGMSGQPSGPDNSLEGLYNQSMRATDAAGNALAKAATERAGILDPDGELQMAKDYAIQTHQNEINEVQNEIKALRLDIQEGTVDPNKFWTGDKNGNGGHSKVMAAIGLILGGFNPTNSPNMAAHMLEKQMEANLEAQKANMNSKHNLLAANMKLLGNMQEAMNMTRIQQNDIIQGYLEHASAKAANPLAKQAAMNAKIQLAEKVVPMIQKQAALRTVSQLTSGAANDPSKMEQVIAALDVVDPDRAKEYRHRAVPGLGFANDPDGAKGLREMQSTVKTIKQDTARLREILNIPGKSASLGLRAEVDGIRQRMIGRLRIPYAGPGTLNPQERASIEGAIPDVTSFFKLDSNSRVSLDTIDRGITNAYRNQAIANGLKVPDAAMIDPRQAAANWLMANPNHPKAAAARKILGQ